MTAFVPVACQHCNAPKIGRIVAGMGSWRCHKCKHWTTAGRDTGGVLRYLQVDRPVVVA